MCIKISIFVPVLLWASMAIPQQPSKFNLHKLLGEQKLELIHRKAEPLIEGNYQGVRLSQDTSEGLAWLKGSSFSFGTIEFDARGKDEFQRSFVGIAFHRENDSTYEAIYFRPFNFFAKDSVRRIHAVQYISHPLNTWRKLREEKTTNAQFEKAVVSPPDPNGWFHVKVKVSDDSVQVFINGRKEPELVVKRLSGTNRGKIGLFAGDGSGGDFANLVIRNSRE